MKSLTKFMLFTFGAMMLLNGCQTEEETQQVYTLNVKTGVAVVDETDVTLSGTYTYDGPTTVRVGFRYNSVKALLSQSEFIPSSPGSDGTFVTQLNGLANGEYWYQAVAELDGEINAGAEGFFKVDFSRIPNIVTGVADITDNGYVLHGNYSFSSKKIPIRVGFLYATSEEGLANAEFRETQPSSAGEFSYTVPLSFGSSCFYQAAAIVEGITYTGEVKKAGMTDLSAAGNANCFIVNEKGWYSFNACKPDGSTVSGDKAEWIWATGLEDGIITNINYLDGKVTFKLDKDSPSSVVIALFSGQTIVWSWHIWVSDVKDQTLGDITFQDRNLGANNVSANSPESIGLMYQFGRKDPFIGTCIMDRTIATNLYESVAFSLDRSLDRPWCADYIVNNEIMAEGFKHISNEVDESVATANPMVHYGKYNAGGLNLSNAEAQDLWGGVSGMKKNQDPCPAGYKVAAFSDYTAFINDILLNSASGASSVYGQTEDGKLTWGRIYTLDGEQYNWPATGWRAWSGIIARPGNVIALSSANVYPNTEKAVSIYWNWGTNPGKNYFSEAFPLRCVKMK